MKAVAIILSILAFGACLFIGIQAGSQTASNTDTKATSTPNLWMSPSQQRTLLVIVADDLDQSSPRLVSTWLVLYRPDLAPITYLPLYPSISTAADSLPDLAGTFTVGSNHIIGSAFANALKNYHVNWNGYILTDEVAIAQAIDWLHGVDLNHDRVDGQKALASLVSPWDDPQGSLSTQENVVLGVCSQVAKLNPDADWMSLAKNLTPNHLQTDLNLGMLITDWKDLITAADPMTCQIPTH